MALLIDKIKELVAPESTYQSLVEQTAAAHVAGGVEGGAGAKKAHELETTGQAEELLDLILPRRSSPASSVRGTLAAYHAAPTFQACARLVAQKMADVEWYVARDGQRVDDHPFLETIRHPNPFFPGWIYRFLQQIYMDVAGETFDLLFEGPGGRLELWPLPPTAVKQVADGWEVKLGDFREIIPKRQMLHLWMPDLLNPYDRGKGIGGVLSDEIEAADYISKHIKSSYFNNARPDFIVNLPNADRDQREAFKSGWVQRFQGVDKSGAPAVVSKPGGDGNSFGIHELSRTIADMEGAELKRLEEKLIRRTWGISPELVGEVEDSNRSTIAASKQIFGEMVITPRCKFWRAGWNHHLMPLVGQEGDTVEHPSQIPEDQAARAEKMNQTPWAFTVNEHRDAAGYGPREDGDAYPRPADNQMTFEDAGDLSNELAQRGFEEPDEGEPADDTIIRLADYTEEKSADPVEVKQTADERARRVAEALEPEPLRTDLEPEVEDKIREFARSTFGEFPIGVDPGDIFFVMDPNIREYVEEFGGDEITGINQTTQDDITGIVDDALKEGTNPRRIRSQIGEYVEETIPNRGETIARTEMNKAQNFGRHETFKASGVVEHKRWLSFRGAREAHGLLGGQDRELDEAFEVPSGNWAGETAMFPGDFGPVELVAECRCGIRAVFPEVEEILGRAASGDAPVIVRGGAGDIEHRDLSDQQIIKSITEQRESAAEEFAGVVTSALRRQFREQVFPAFDEIFAEELSA